MAKSTKFTWSIAMESKLIEMVRQREFLWNSSHPLFIKRNLKRSECISIAKRMKKYFPLHAERFTYGSVIEKFQKLRAYYKRWYRRMKTSKTDAEGMVLIPKWHHFDRMSFMSGTIASSPTTIQRSDVVLIAAAGESRPSTSTGGPCNSSGSVASNAANSESTAACNSVSSTSSGDFVEEPQPNLPIKVEPLDPDEYISAVEDVVEELRLIPKVEPVEETIPNSAEHNDIQFNLIPKAEPMDEDAPAEPEPISQNVQDASSEDQQLNMILPTPSLANSAPFKPTNSAPFKSTNSAPAISANPIPAIPMNSAPAKPTNSAPFKSTNSAPAIPMNSAPAKPTNSAPFESANSTPAIPVNPIPAIPTNSASVPHPTTSSVCVGAPAGPPVCHRARVSTTLASNAMANILMTSIDKLMSRDDDEELAFGRSVSASLKKIRDPKKRYQAKKDILEVLMNHSDGM